MSRLILVRHGQAAASWGEHPDPGLSDVGRAQAEAMATALAPLGPLPIIVSPLRRTRETAAALERAWANRATVDAAVGEVPAPFDENGSRHEWFGRLMSGTWSSAPECAIWRQGVIDRIAAIDTNSIVVSHFVAINVAVGHALGDERVLCFTPQNCSRTVLDVVEGGLTVVELGEQATAQLT